MLRALRHGSPRSYVSPTPTSTPSPAGLAAGVVVFDGSTAARDTADVAKRSPQPTAIESAELDEARHTLRRGEAVRLVVGARIVLCSSLDEVRAAQLGRIPHDAVRLDGAARR